MQYVLARDWRFVGGPELPDGVEPELPEKLKAGTVVGSIDIPSDLPMTDRQFIDGIRTGLIKAAEKPEAGAEEKKLERYRELQRQARSKGKKAAAEKSPATTVSDE